MKVNVDLHYCKWCETTFKIDLAANVSGDYLLRCPQCTHPHYRHFINGEAVHCDINKRHEDPKLIEGKFL